MAGNRRLKAFDQDLLRPFAEDRVIERWASEGKPVPVKGGRHTYTPEFERAVTAEIEALREHGFDN